MATVPRQIRPCQRTDLGALALCLLLVTPMAAWAADDDQPLTQSSSLGSTMGLAGAALLGGFKLNPQWSVGADYLNLNDSPTASPTEINLSIGNSERLYSIHGIALSGTGTLPINQGLSLFGKLGVLSWNGSDRGTDNVGLFGMGNMQGGLDLTYGAGGQYLLGGGLSLHAEWDRSYINQGDIDLFSAGVRYNFK